MYDLTHFTLRDMTECGAALRRLGIGCKTMEEVGGQVVRFFYEEFLDRRDHEPCWVLVRFYKTYAYGVLEPAEQARAVSLAGKTSLPAHTRCLKLVSTAGARPEWNDPELSRGHGVIPISSPELGRAMPLLAQLAYALAAETDPNLAVESSVLLDPVPSSHHVCYVPEGTESALLAGKTEFLRTNGVRSVLGFGGQLPSRNLFAVILFARVPIPRQTAELFKTMTLNVKLAVLPFAGGTSPF